MLLLWLLCMNASIGSLLIDRAIHAVHLYGGNVLEVPIYWNVIEPEENRYEGNLIPRQIEEACGELPFGFSPQTFLLSQHFQQRPCTVPELPGSLVGQNHLASFFGAFHPLLALPSSQQDQAAGQFIQGKGNPYTIQAPLQYDAQNVGAAH